jgi:hypothetical protein
MKRVPRGKQPGESPRGKTTAEGKVHPLDVDLDIRIRRRGPITWREIAAVGAGLASLVYWLLKVAQSLVR